MFQPEYDFDDLDEYNFRSAVREVGRQYLDGRLEDNRRLNELIAHYAELLVSKKIAFDGRIQTTLHSEQVTISVDSQRAPVYEESFVLDVRKDMAPEPRSRRHWLNRFRDVMAGYVFQVARKGFTIAEQTHFRQASRQPTSG